MMKEFRRPLHCIVLMAFAVILCAFGSASKSGSRETSFAIRTGKVTQAELQDDLLRFETQFNARIENASGPLEASPNARISDRAMVNRLNYSSNALNIALGPTPEVNLLDMVAFIELSRDVLEKHWIPKIFGAGGRPEEQAFSDSAQQIWAIAGKVMSPQQKAVLQKVISRWRQAHPKQISVETVRLSAFSGQGGADAADLDKDIGGLFASVQQSTQAVDAARLFAERALYYAERAPFLFRLQERIGADEILDDAQSRLSQAALPLKLSNDMQIDFESTRLIRKLVWLGVGLITFFWTMYLISKITYRFIQRRWLSTPRAMTKKSESPEKKRAA